jgi:hypothetical protein
LAVLDVSFSVAGFGAVYEGDVVLRDNALSGVSHAPPSGWLDTQLIWGCLAERKATPPEFSPWHDTYKFGGEGESG